MERFCAKCFYAAFAGGIHGEDQSSFRTEVEAVRNVLEALLIAVRRADDGSVRRHSVLVCDCKAAIQVC